MVYAVAIGAAFAVSLPLHPVDPLLNEVRRYNN